MLVIDADAQANSSSILLQNMQLRETHSLVDALTDTNGTKQLSQIACATSIPNLQIIPNTARCMLWEREVAKKAEAIFGIDMAIKRDSGLRKYDFIIFDTPPNLGTMMNNALMASDFIIIPIPPSDQFALDGMASFLKLIGSIRKYNKRLKLLGIMICKYDENWGQSANNLQKIETYFAKLGIHVFRSRIHNSPEIDIANMHRQTLFESQQLNTSAKEHALLSMEILETIDNVT